MEMIAVVESLSALAHEGRLKVFRLLVTAGPTGMAAGEIPSAVNLLTRLIDSLEAYLRLAPPSGAGS